MRSLIGTVALFAVAMSGHAARAAEPQSLSTQITAVTVYADRAQVTRSAPIELSSEPTRLCVNKLPGWIDVESVRVALEPPTAGQVLDVAVETAYLAQASEEATRLAQAAARDVGDEIAAIADEERTLNEEIARLDAVRTMSLDKVPRELAVGEVKLKNLGETMSYVTETVRNDRKLMRALAKKRRDLEPVLAQKQRELVDLQARSQLQQSTVLVELKGAGRAQLKITYLTPGASWEPQGELRVSRGGSAVNVVQTASVTQTTGEDWTSAKLSFSTQNPGDMLDVPRAKRLVLDRNGMGLGAVVDTNNGGGVGGESFSRAQAKYAEGNENVAKGKSDWRESLQRQSEAQLRAVERFSKIASRGTTAHFAALSDRTVRADGKPVRVPIASGDFNATTKLVAVPEMSLNAVRVVDLVNGGSFPILPARVMLYEDGAFVGKSELDFVSPGESFSAFLGVQDGVKLERTLDKKSSALKRRAKRTEMALSFVGSAENLGNTSVTIELSERIPVAQTEEIEVNDLELPHKLKPDAQGVVRWTETIAPRTKLTWRVGYKLEYPTDFVVRSRAADAAAPAAPAAAEFDERMAPPASAAPAPRAAPKARKMYEQIDQLENSF